MLRLIILMYVIMPFANADETDQKAVDYARAYNSIIIYAIVNGNGKKVYNGFRADAYEYSNQAIKITVL